MKDRKNKTRSLTGTKTTCIITIQVERRAVPCQVRDRKAWCRKMMADTSKGKAVTSQKLYDQVFERIKDKIRSGELRQGSLLPGENKLAEEMGVSRVTVRQALKQLSEAGIVETHKGKGSVVIVDWKALLDKGEHRDKAEECQATFHMSTRARRMMEPMVAVLPSLMCPS